MKTLNFLIIGLALMLGVSARRAAYALDAPEVTQEHLALAASYEQKAADQDALIAEHTQMKQEYKDRFFVNEKVTPVAKIQKMNDHCDAIIQEASKLRDEFLGFAKWHRMRAAELQGL